MKYQDIEFEPFFTWSHRTRIMYSPGIRSEVGYEMSQIGGTKAVIITDKGLVGAGVAAKVAEAVESSSKLELVGIFDDIVQDARMEKINKGAAFYREKGADCMIVVGGGSVMDTAKAINILICEGADDFKPFADQLGLYEDAKLLPPQIVFPTTSGTGSEVTTAMVVLDEETHTKMAVAHPNCPADIAMLDPELVVGLPGPMTAATGMDALTHAIEGVTSTTRNPLSDALGYHAIRLISKYLAQTVKEPGNIEARGNMMLASTLAGMCFINSFVGGVHAMAHALGGLYGVPHGLGNGIMLPVVMEYNCETEPERFSMTADAMGINIEGKTSAEIAKDLIQAVKDLKTEIGITQTLKDLKIPSTKEKLDELVELAYADSQLPYNSRELEEEDLFTLFQKAM